jgi:hypothetical protein
VTLTTLTVGLHQTYHHIADAIAASRDGDVVAVQAETYVNDFATVTHRITLQGIGGMVRMVATVAPRNGKAILTTDSDVTIDHFEFSGAKVADRNGAGIRYEKGNLVITNSYFHDNENGLLGAPDASGTITVKSSEFGHNGNGNGLTHNIYVGVIKQLTIQDSYFHDAVVGHEIKSRALNTVVTGSCIQDNAGTASYAIDLPQGGNALIQGNVIQKGSNAPNPVIIAFGEEGRLHSSSALVVRANTIVNDDRGGVAIWNATSSKAAMESNQLYGLGSAPANRGTVAQTGTTMLASRPALSLASPVGNGQTALVFSLSEDAWHGDAQATISVDGQQLGGVCTISASHALNQTQKLSFLVTLSAGPHTASVAFLNDAYGGTAAADRNLYVSSIDVGAQRIATAATFYSNGAKSFAMPATVPANSTLMHTLLPST